MSEPILFPNLLKSIPTATSLSGQSMICVDSSGNPAKYTVQQLTQYQMQVTGQYVFDFNEATTAGVYSLDGSSTPLNGPEGIGMWAGMLEVFYRGGTTGLVYQRATSSQGIMAVRTRYYGEWTPWRVLQ